MGLPSPRRLGFALLTSLAALSASCARGPLLQSRPVSPSETMPQQGTSYYLPKKVLKIDLWVTASPVTAPVLDAAGQPVFDNGVQQVKNDVRLRYFATFADERLIPDTRYHFMLETRENSSSDDIVDVQITPDGLLDLVSGVATDRSKDIVGGFSSLVSLIVAGMARYDEGRPYRGGIEELLMQPPRLVATYQVDPVDPADLARLRAELEPKGIRLTVQRDPDCPVALSGPGCAKDKAGCQPGVYYRLPIPYRIALSPSAELPYPRMAPVMERVQVLESLERTFLLPNEALEKFVAVTRAAFVSKRTMLDFEQGMLVKASTDKPSELLGFVMVPVEAAKAIFSIPAELLKIRVEEIQKDMLAAQRMQAQSSAEVQQMQLMLEMLRLTQQYKALSAPQQPQGQ